MLGTTWKLPILDPARQEILHLHPDGAQGAAEAEDQSPALRDRQRQGDPRWKPDRL